MQYTCKISKCHLANKYFRLEISSRMCYNIYKYKNRAQTTMCGENELLKGLNSEQISPVLDTEGAVLVIAGAGSGKTRVLTSRIAHLVLDKGVSPDNIMAITFTNKAAKEMKERLKTLIGDLGDMWVSTIHSMCVRILRYNAEKIGYSKDFTIYDDSDKEKTLKRAFEDLNLESDKLLKTVKNHISNAKNECMSPSEYREYRKDMRFIDDICKIYQKYEELLFSSNAMDFDDLLCKTYKLFVEHPEVADVYAEHFHYIHIDEFQDTNTVQFQIAKRLALKHGNIFAVGDDDQSIYSWRGAKIENILNFDNIFSGAKVYKLERNYRSTKNILKLANCIILNNQGRREKELWTENGDGSKIETFVAGDELAEAQYVAMQIKGLMARTELNYSDFAVFMRINAISRAVEQEFIKYGIPYKVYGGFRFFERKEIKDVLAYLKLVCNPFDNEAFIRAVGTPKRGIGDKTLSELRHFASEYGMSMFDAIDRLDLSDIASGGKTKLRAFKSLIEDIKNYSKENPVYKVIDYILDTTDFMLQFEDKTEENKDRIMNISELKNSAVQFLNDNPNTTISDYLNSITLSSDTDDINSDNCVSVATIHASKGLEFPCVFVIGVDEKILPVTQNFEDLDEIEEERRLMYVAITRAKERLYLTRARSRFMYGSREFMSPSRFLKEGQSVLAPVKPSTDSMYSAYSPRKTYGSYGDEVSENSTRTVGGYSSGYAKSLLKNSKPQENKKVNYNGFTAGVKVKHIKFGEGVIISVKGSGDNIVVDVLFKGVGMKSLSAKYAPMEIL